MRFRRKPEPVLTPIETIAKNRALILADDVKRLAQELVDRAGELKQELNISAEERNGS